MAKRNTYQEQLGISEEALIADFRWPETGDRAFQQNENWEANTPLAKGGHTRLVFMADGYKEGADAMVSEALVQTHKSEMLVFPILFNYRHFIELSIKYTIATYGATVGIEPVWNTHDLIPLWNRLLEVFDGYGTNDPDRADQVVGTIIEEFSKLDPHSFSNRYPVDTKGKLIELTQDEVDLAALRNTMESVANFFTGADGYLDSLQGASP